MIPPRRQATPDGAAGRLFKDLNLAPGMARLADGSAAGAERALRCAGSRLRRIRDRRREELPAPFSATRCRHFLSEPRKARLDECRRRTRRSGPWVEPAALHRRAHHDRPETIDARHAARLIRLARMDPGPVCVQRLGHDGREVLEGARRSSSGRVTSSCGPAAASSARTARPSSASRPPRSSIGSGHGASAVRDGARGQ